MFPHPWNISPAEAIALQRRLAPLVDARTPLDLEAVHLVAGVDVSVKNEISRAAIAVLRFPSLELVEAVTAEMPTSFPYIPGLLSFREGAVILAAHHKLRCVPDVYLFDGMGIMHPRRLGIAAHMGLWLEKPTIGCGKTYLIGQYDDPTPQAGSYATVWDKGEALGIVLRTRANVKPIYLSVGHRATIETARTFTLRCVTRYRLPEPIRAAHRIAGGA